MQRAPQSGFAASFAVKVVLTKRGTLATECPFPFWLGTATKPLGVELAQPTIANPQNAGLNAAGDLGDLMSEPYLQLHLEPSEHIEVSELTGALTALARQ